MNIWQRGSSFTFQKRIPSDLVGVLGASPIRLVLPPCGKRRAHREAAVLNGVAEAQFQRLRVGIDDMDGIREKILGDLREALEIQQRLIIDGGLGEKAGLSSSDNNELRKSVNSIADCVVSVEASEATTETTIGGLLKEIRDLHSAVSANRQKLPLFSKEFPKCVEVKSKAKPKSTFPKYTLPAACNAFLEIVGDKPLDDYRPKDMEEFGLVLAAVPANRAKLRRFSGISYRQAGELNAKLRKPYPTLSATSIQRQYLAPIKSVFRWLCDNHLVPSPIDRAATTAPTHARPAEDRDPVPVNKLAKLLETAAKLSRPDDKWLPLLGFVTGCRLSELIYMQGRDVKWNRYAKAWTFDLKGTILVKGKEEPRPLKNWGSRRIITLPHFFVETGFIDWARERPGFIFEQIHRTKHPRSTASKRMNRLMDKCGIQKRSQVFHSLRHSHKDWLRLHIGQERTIDLQSGHTLEGTSRKYGEKHLKTEEILELAECPLPNGIVLPDGYMIREATG